MINHFAIALLTMAAGAPASAQTTPQVPGPSPAPTTAAPVDKKICRREPVLGSNLSKKTCRTKADWAAIARAHRDQTDQLNGMARARQSNGMVPTT